MLETRIGLFAAVENVWPDRFRKADFPLFILLRFSSSRLGGRHHSSRSCPCCAAVSDSDESSTGAERDDSSFCT